MLKFKNRIVFTGGTGRFANAFKKKQIKTKLHFYFPNKKQLDILKINSIKNYLRKKRPKYLQRSNDSPRSNKRESINNNLSGKLSKKQKN